jgi:glycosyltransferase involved in cell wall biosynthesis
MMVIGEPLVSVIVPNYNHARFLPERLASIFNQSYQNIEVILLDDASDDNSGTILQSWAAEYPQVRHLYINENNTGRAICQWQRGVELASGDYIWIAESDDVAAPNFIETLLTLIAEKPNVGFAYCDSEVINEHGGSLGTYVYSSPLSSNENPWSHSFSMAGKEFAGCYMAYRNVIPNVSAVLFSASVIKSQIQASELKYCADWQLYNRILCHYDIIFCRQPLNQFRKHVLSSRWHDSVSYGRELKEKVVLLKEFRQLMAGYDHYQLNINKSLKYILANRHKYTRVDKLCKRLNSVSLLGHKVFLYGANDISEQVACFLSSIDVPWVVVDKNKAGVDNGYGLIMSPTKTVISMARIVVLCSLQHQASMHQVLLDFGFDGTLYKI